MLTLIKDNGKEYKRVYEAEDEEEEDDDLIASFSSYLYSPLGFLNSVIGIPFKFPFGLRDNRRFAKSHELLQFMHVFHLSVQLYVYKVLPDNSLTL
jgi:hypothetical protein